MDYSLKIIIGYVFGFQFRILTNKDSGSKEMVKLKIPLVRNQIYQKAITTDLSDFVVKEKPLLSRIPVGT